MCCTLLACDKLPANGDLDGMWQLMEIEHDGITKYVQEDQIYMSIQLKLFMLGEKGYTGKYYGYFEHKDGKIHFWQFSHPSKNESAADDNVPIAENEKSILEKWGYYSLDETFTVEKLTKDIMELKNGNTTIRYIKF